MNTGGKQDREKRIWPMELVNDTPLWVRAVMLLLFDALAVYLSSFLALAIRFEFDLSRIEIRCIDSVYRYLAVNVLCTIVVFYLFRLYTSLWKYASVQELCNIVFAVVTTGVL